MLAVGVVYGAAFVVAPDRETGGLSDALDERLNATDARTGVTALPNDAGVAVRALGDRAETVQDALRAAWDHARRDLIGAAPPPGRKY